MSNQVIQDSVALELTFDTDKFKKSAQELEKHADKVAKNVAKKFDKSLNSSNVFKNTQKSLGKLAENFDDNLNPAIKQLNTTVKQLGKSLSQIDKTLSSIKVKSNISIKGSFDARDILNQIKKSSVRSKSESSSSSNSTAESLLPVLWQNFVMKGSAKQSSLAFKRVPTSHGLETIKARGWSSRFYHYEQSDFRNPAAHKPLAIEDQRTEDEKNAIDAKWRHAKFSDRVRSKFSFASNKTSAFFGKTKDVIGGFFTKEDRQQKKRTKAEDKFISNLTKLALVFGGVQSINSAINKVTDVIKEGGKLNYLSSFTGEDASQLFAYNEAIKRTTHADSYDVFENFRQRTIDAWLHPDSDMATTLAMYGVNASPDLAPGEAIGKIRSSQLFKQNDRFANVGLFNKLGIPSNVAMALTSGDFDDKYKHVKDIGSFTDEQAQQTKELMNMWEDIEQQSKMMVLELMPLIKSFMELAQALAPIIKPFVKAAANTVGVAVEGYKKTADVINQGIKDPRSIADKIQAGFDKANNEKKLNKEISELNPQQKLALDKLQNPEKLTQDTTPNFVSANNKYDLGSFAKQTQKFENASGNPNAINSAIDPYTGKRGTAIGKNQILESTANLVRPGTSAQDLLNPKINDDVRDGIIKWNDQYINQNYPGLSEVEHRYLMNEMYMHGMPKESLAQIKAGGRYYADADARTQQQHSIEIKHSFDGVPEHIDEEKLTKGFEKLTNRQNFQAMLGFGNGAS